MRPSQSSQILDGSLTFLLKTLYKNVSTYADVYSFLKCLSPSNVRNLTIIPYSCKTSIMSSIILSIFFVKFPKVSKCRCATNDEYLLSRGVTMKAKMLLSNLGSLGIVSVFSIFIACFSVTPLILPFWHFRSYVVRYDASYAKVTWMFLFLGICKISRAKSILFSRRSLVQVPFVIMFWNNSSLIFSCSNVYLITLLRLMFKASDIFASWDSD